MKKQILSFAVAALMTAAFAFAAGKDDNVMWRQSDGTYVVNTTTLAANVKKIYKKQTNKQTMYVVLKGLHLLKCILKMIK